MGAEESDQERGGRAKGGFILIYQLYLLRIIYIILACCCNWSESMIILSCDVALR